MSLQVLRKSLFLSFVAASSLTAGVILYQELYRLPPPVAELDNLNLQGQLAPEISATTLDGEKFVLSHWRGQTVLINFWATWCPPCLAEVPALIEMQEKYAAQGLRIAGIGIDEIPALKKFDQRVSFNYPVIQATFRLMEQFGNLRGTLPYSILLDKHGHIISQYFQPLEHADLDKILSEAVGE